jgi:hypothetical protein
VYLFFLRHFIFDSNGFQFHKLKSIFLFGVFIFFCFKVSAQEIFTELPVNPGFVFEANQINYEFPKLIRNKDINGNVFSLNNDTLLKTNGNQIDKYPINLNDSSFKNSIFLNSNEFILKIKTTYFSTDPVVYNLNDKVAFRAETYYLISNLDDNSIRSVYRNILCYFDGQKINVYDEKSMIGIENDQYLFYGLAHTEKYVWVLSLSGVIQLNKNTNEFKLYHSNNSNCVDVTQYKTNLF